MIQWQFPPSQRNVSPIMQVVTGVIGLVVIVALGLFALGAAAIVVVGLAVAFGIRRLLSGQPRKPAQPFNSAASKEPAEHGNVFDGEYVVVDSKTAAADDLSLDRNSVLQRRPTTR